MYVTVWPFRRLKRWMEERGVDADAVLTSAGVAPSALSDDALLVPEAALGECLVAAAAATGDPMPGVSLASVIMEGEAGVLGFLFANHATLGAALAAAGGWWSAFRPGHAVHFRRGPRVVDVVVTTPDDAPWRQHEVHEVLALTMRLVKRALPRPWSPEAVLLRHVSPVPGLLGELGGAPEIVGADHAGLRLRVDDLDALLPGADPYLLSHLEVAARAHLLRVEEAVGLLQPRVLKLSGCTVDLQAATVWRGGETFTLTTRERELLTYFARRPNRVVTQTDLDRDVWGIAEHVISHAPAVAVRRLRAKIEADPQRPVNLLTLRGDGWRLVVPPQ